jgi:hypothetical protein
MKGFPFFFGGGGGWSGTNSTILRPFIGLLHHPWIMDSADCGAMSRLIDWLIDRGNWITRRKYAPVSFCEPQIWPGLEHSPSRGIPSTNSLSYGTDVSEGQSHEIAMINFTFHSPPSVVHMPVLYTSKQCDNTVWCRQSVALFCHGSYM